MSTKWKPKKWIKKLKDGLTSSKSDAVADPPARETARPIVHEAEIPQDKIAESTLPTHDARLTQPLIEEQKSPVLSPPEPLQPPTSSTTVPTPQENMKPKPIPVLSSKSKSKRSTEVPSLSILLTSHGLRATQWEPMPTDVDEALCYAVKMGKDDLVGELLRRGAQVRTSTGPWLSNSALHRAIADRREWLFQRLIDATPSDLDSPNERHSKTPLSLACEKGLTDLAQELLDRGAALESRDYLGRTPLHQAARSDHLATVMLLLARGADISAIDNQGRSALDRARTAFHYATFNALQRAAYTTQLQQTSRDTGTKTDKAKDQTRPKAHTNIVMPPSSGRAPAPAPAPVPVPVPRQTKETDWITSIGPGHIEVQVQDAAQASETDWDDGFSIVEYRFIKEEPPEGSSQVKPSVVGTDAVEDWDDPLQVVSYKVHGSKGTVRGVQISKPISSSGAVQAPSTDDDLVGFPDAIR